MNNLPTPLTEDYLDSFHFEMFSAAGNNACRSIVRAAWKKLAGKARVSAEEMYEYLQTRMNKASEKHGEIWDTEPRENIFYLVNKKAREFDYDYSNYFGGDF